MILPALLLLASPVLHVGFHDPETEGWSSTVSTLGVSVGAGTEHTASGPHHYWSVHDETSAGGGAYAVELDAASFAGDWRLAVSARVVDSPVVPGYPDVPGTGLIVRDGQNYWSFYLANEWVGPMGSAGSLARKHWMDTRDDYHCYVIERSPAGDTADFYVDGALVFANVPRNGLYVAPDRAVSFGPVSTDGTSHARYEYVRFKWDPDGDLGGQDAHAFCRGSIAPAPQAAGDFLSPDPDVASGSPDAIAVAGGITEVRAGCSVAATHGRPLPALAALALSIVALRLRRRSTGQNAV